MHKKIDPFSLTVKIVISQHSYATGFFISSSKIVTCAHVLAGANLNTIELFWMGREKLKTNISLAFSDDIYDLALLQIEPQIQLNLDRPLLERWVSPGSRYVAYGYTDSYPNGNPVLLICEGLTGDTPPLIKLQAGRIRPGLSGAPLFNLETGNLSGIIKYTDDRSLNTGGGAIPASSVFEKVGLTPEFLAEEIIEMTSKNVDANFFTNKQSLYLDRVDTEIKHANMWRWNQRMFRHRHPQEYLGMDLVGLEQGRSWWKKYHDEDWVLRDWNHDQIGTYCINPVTKEVFEELSNGAKIETDITPEDILSANEAKNHKYWYWSNFMRARVKPSVNKIVKEYANNLIAGNALYSALTSPHFATSSNEEIYMIAFAETKSTQKFVNSYGFTKAFPHSTDPKLSQVYLMLLNKDMIENRLTRLNEWFEENSPTIEKYNKKSIFQQPPNY